METELMKVSNNQFVTALVWVLIIEVSYIWCSSNPLARRWLYKKHSVDTNVSLRVDKPRQDGVNSAIQCSVNCMGDHRCIFFQFENNACYPVIIQDKYQPSTNLINTKQYFFTEDANLFETDDCQGAAVYRSSVLGPDQMKSLMLVCVNKVSWNIANTTCVDMGGQLTDPYSSSKNPVVEEAVNAAKYALVHKYGTSGTGESFWMGGRCPGMGVNCTTTETGWSWSSGSQWDTNFHHFGTNHPTVNPANPICTFLDVGGQPIWWSMVCDNDTNNGFACEIKLV